MKALQIIKYGELTDSLAFTEVDKPSVQAQDVLIEVKASAINPIDKSIVLGNLQAMLPIPLPSTSAYDVSGVVVEKGAEVLFENLGVEAFVPGRHMVKEDGSELKQDEIADFKIIEFNKDSRRVVASHTEIHKALNAEKNQTEKKQTNKAVKKIQGNVERSTLGDLDALSKLKEQMEEDEKK